MELRDFSAGLYLPGEAAPTTEQAGFAVPANALLQADNVEFLTEADGVLSGGLRGRRGRQPRGQMPGPVVGLFRHYPRLGVGQLGPIAQAFYQTDGSIGSVDWTNPVGAGTSGGNAASVDLSADDESFYLQALGGFAVNPIPAGTVRGIEVYVTGYDREQRAIIDNAVVLFVAGVANGENRARTSVGKTQWTSEPVTIVYGSPTDTWGLTLTDADVNSGNFGAAISVKNNDRFSPNKFFVNYMTIAVYFDSDSEPVLLAASIVGTGIEHRVYDPGTSTFLPLFNGVQPETPTGRPRYTMLPSRGLTLIFDGVNPPLQFQPPTTLQQIPQTGELAPRKGPYATTFKDRIVATDPDDDTFVYFSEILDQTNWQSDAALTYNDKGGGRVVGVEGMGDLLVALKTASLWSFIGDVLIGGQLTQYSDFGCQAPDTVQVTPYGIIFLAIGGLYLTDGLAQVPICLSDPLRSLFVARDGSQVSYPNAVGVYHRRADAYLLRLSQDAGETWRLQHVARRNRDGTIAAGWAWSRMPDMPLNAGCCFNGAGDTGQLWIGGPDGKVLEADTGLTDTVEDEAVPIDVRLRTACLQIDRALRNGRINQMYAEFRGNEPLEGVMRYDEALTDAVSFEVGETLPAVAIQRARSTIVDQASFGRTVSVSLLAAGGPDFELYRLLWTAQSRGVIAWP